MPTTDNPLTELAAAVFGLMCFWPLVRWASKRKVPAESVYAEDVPGFVTTPSVREMAAVFTVLMLGILILCAAVSLAEHWVIRAARPEEVRPDPDDTRVLYYVRHYWLRADEVTKLEPGADADDPRDFGWVDPRCGYRFFRDWPTPRVSKQ